MFPVTRRWSAARSGSHRTPQPGRSRCGCSTWPGGDRTSLRRLGWRRSTSPGGCLGAPTSNWSAKSRRTLPASQPWVRPADHIRRNAETSRSIAFRDAEAAGWPKSIGAPVVVQDSSLGRHAAVPAVSVNWAGDPAELRCAVRCFWPVLRLSSEYPCPRVQRGEPSGPMLSAFTRMHVSPLREGRVPCEGHASTLGNAVRCQVGRFPVARRIHVIDDTGVLLSHRMILKAPRIGGNGTRIFTASDGRQPAGRAESNRRQPWTCSAPNGNACRSCTGPAHLA